MPANEYESMMERFLQTKILKSNGFLNAIKKNKEELTDYFIPCDDEIILIEHKTRVKEFNIPPNINELTFKTLSTEEKDILLEDWNDILGKIRDGYDQLNNASKYIEQQLPVYKNNHDYKKKIEIKYSKPSKIHKIVILLGIDHVCKQYFQTQYSSLSNDRHSYTENTDNFKYFADKKSEEEYMSYHKNDNYTHVFTFSEFEFLLNYLSSKTDLINFLNYKEKLISKGLFHIDNYNLLINFFTDNTINQKVIDSLNFTISNNIFYIDNLSIENKILNFVKTHETLKTKNLLFRSLLEHAYENDANNTVIKRMDGLDFSAQTIISNFMVDMTIDNNKYHYGIFRQKNSLFFFFSYNDINIKTDDLIIAFRNHILYILHKNYKNIIDNLNIIIFDKDSNKGFVTTMFGMDIKWDIIDTNQLKDNKDFIDFEEKLLHLFPKMSGEERNKPCPCGSGRKFKKCCGV